MDTRDPNKTQLMGGVPSIDADGDATVFMPANGAPVPAPAPRSAAMTSRLRDLPTTELPPRAVQTTVLPDSAPTTVAPTAAAPAPDGIDALGDPYISPVDLGNLTTARRPVDLESPVTSVWYRFYQPIKVMGTAARGRSRRVDDARDARPRPA